MASPLYSLRILAQAALTPAVGRVGPTVPAGLVYVVRDIDVRCDSASSGDTLVVFNQVGGFLRVFVHDPAINGFSQEWRGRQVFAEGETVQVESFQGSWDVAISGYGLSAP